MSEALDMTKRILYLPSQLFIVPGLAENFVNRTASDALCDRISFGVTVVFFILSSIVT